MTTKEQLEAAFQEVLTLIDHERKPDKAVQLICEGRDVRDQIGLLIRLNQNVVERLYQPRLAVSDPVRAWSRVIATTITAISSAADAQVVTDADSHDRILVRAHARAVALVDTLAAANATALVDTVISVCSGFDDRRDFDFTASQARNRDALLNADLARARTLADNLAIVLERARVVGT